MLILNMLSDALSHGFHLLLLWVDGVVYWAASKCYQLFMMLATSRIFEDEFFANFARRIYAILGVFMLFYLAYALLNALVDPEKLSKGDKSTSNIAINFVVSLVLLGLMPTIFSYAYRLQNFVLANDVLGAVILGGNVNNSTSADQFDNNNDKITFGDSISFTVLNTFINPDNVNVNMGSSGGYTWYDCKKDILEHSDYICLTGLAKPYVYQSGNEEIRYYGIISTIVGGYLVYILLSFALDLGVRVVKLAFYQLIAPVPIIMRALPSKKGNFDKWLKKTISTYTDVFVRVGFMYLSVYFISQITQNNKISEYWGQGFTGLLVLCIIIMGIFTFAKQASKEISEILGVDSKISMGIRDKLKAATDVMNKTPIVGAGMSLAGMGVGAITGAAGAGWSSLVNGNGFLNGVAFGGIEGAKKGGLQFGRQRQEMYGKLGGKGEAGWLGGRGYMDRKIADFEDHIVDDYKDKVLRERIERFEATNPRYRQEYDSILQEKRNATNNLIATLTGEKNRIMQERLSAEQDYNQRYSEREQNFNNDKNNRLKPLQEKLNGEIAEFNANKAEKLAELTTRLNSSTSAREQNGIREQMKLIQQREYHNYDLESQINSIQNETFTDTEFDASSFDSQINQIEAQINEQNERLNGTTVQVKEINPENGKVETVDVNALVNEAREEARKNVRDKEVEYDSEVKRYKARISDKETKARLDEPEAQYQAALLGKALESINKKGGGPSGGGPSGGGPSGPKK